MKQLSFKFHYVLDYEWLLVERRKNYVRELCGRLYTLGIDSDAYDMPRFRMFIVEERHRDN